MGDLKAVLGRRVRSLRQARGWTQEQLAKESGLGTKYIGVIERGEREASLTVVEKLARALDVDYYQLFVPQQRRTESIKKEINAMLDDTSRINLARVEEFLRGIRACLRRLDRQASSGS